MQEQEGARLTATGVQWIENFFSEEYEKSLRTIRYAGPLIVFGVPAIFLISYAHTIKGKFTGLGIAAIGGLIAILGLRRGDGNLPTRIGVSKDGLYFVKRNGKEGFVPWEKVYRIRVMDSRHPKDYMFYYTKSDSGFVQWLYKYFIDFPELAMGFDAAQAVIKAHDEYRERESSFSSV